MTGPIDALLDNADHLVRNVNLATLHTTLQAEHLEAGPGDHVRERLLQRSRLLRQAMAEILRAGIADGELRGCLDPEATAAEIIAFQNGALILWRLDPENTDLWTLYRQADQQMVLNPTTNFASSYYHKQWSHGVHGECIFLHPRAS